MMQPKRLSDRFFVTSQIAPAELQALADGGFRSIIGNRPDGEERGQPEWATIEQAAQEAGMEARHIPLTAGAIGEADVSAFATALEELPTPILGFCRTGMRSASIWALSNAGKRPAEQLIAAAAEAGYDLSQLRDRIGQV